MAKARDIEALCWIVAILLLAGAAIAVAWFPLATIRSPASVNYNEGWNAYREWIAWQGQPLYAARGHLWTTNYPFLSFHIVGALGRARQNMLLAGRALGFASLAAIALLAAAAAGFATRSRRAALFCGLLLFASLAAFDGNRRAMNDPEMLGGAFATLGLLLYLRASGPAALAAAAIAFALSLFTKQDFIAFPIAAACHLALTRQWRRLAIFAMAGILACAVLLALTLRLDGRFFLAELVQPRAYTFAHMFAKSVRYVMHFGLISLVAAAALWPARDLPLRFFLLLLLLLTDLVSAGFAGGDGVASNIFYPASIACVLACSIGIARLRGWQARAALAVATFAGVSMAVCQLRNDIAAQGRVPLAIANARQAEAVLRAASGPAICEDILLCYNAGKPLDYDPYYVKDQLLIHHLREPDILALLQGRHYAAIELDGAMDGNWQSLMSERFTPGFQRTLLADYRPVLVTRYDVVLVPK